MVYLTRTGKETFGGSVSKYRGKSLGVVVGGRGFMWWDILFRSFREGTQVRGGDRSGGT